MASGLLGKSALPAATWTSVYTCPVGKVATANIRVVNTDTTGSALLRLAISTASGAAASADYIEPIDYVMNGGEILEDIGLVMGAGEIVNAYASTANIVIRVHGFESNP